MAKTKAGEPAESVGLTAREFFAKDLNGCRVREAHFQTQLSYAALYGIADGSTKAPAVESLRKLEAWSRVAGAEHGVYISAARTAGFTESEGSK